MSRILVITEQLYLTLYRCGLEHWAKNNKKEIDFFHIDHPNKMPLSVGEKLYAKVNKKARSKFFDELREELIKKMEGYDEILFINLLYDDGYFINESVAEILRKKIAKIYFVDSITTLSENFRYWDVFQKIYSFEYTDTAFAKQTLGIHVEYVPVGTSYNLYFDTNAAYEKKYDICFIGIAEKKRLKYLTAIAELAAQNNLRFWASGNFWHNNNWLNYTQGKFKFKWRNPILAKYAQNRFMQPEDVAKIYAQSKIVVNINVACHNGINPRAFDVMACNSLLISDRQNLSGVSIEAGKDFVMCEAEADMLKKIKYYLAHESEMDNMIQSAREKTYRSYLSAHTWNTILGES